jgi:hypothetical protein
MRSAIPVKEEHSGERALSSRFDKISLDAPALRCISGIGDISNDDAILLLCGYLL